MHVSIMSWLSWNVQIIFVIQFSVHAYTKCAVLVIGTASSQKGIPQAKKLSKQPKNAVNAFFGHLDSLLNGIDFHITMHWCFELWIMKKWNDFHTFVHSIWISLWSLWLYTLHSFYGVTDDTSLIYERSQYYPDGIFMWISIC